MKNTNGRIMSLKYFITIILMIIWTQASAQDLSGSSFHVPQIGEKIPAIPLAKGKNIPKTKMTLNDYEGKIIILDFWTTGCPSCIEAFPKMEALQRQFSADIQIILINPWETEEKVHERIKHTKNRSLKSIGLPYIIGDSTWRKFFPHQFVPHHVWIDKTGRLLANTMGNTTTEITIKKLISGEQVFLKEKRDIPLRNSLISQEDSINDRPLFYNTISKYNPGIPSRLYKATDTAEQTFRLTVFNRSVVQLYEMANPNKDVGIIFESNQNKFLASPKYDDDAWMNKYVYSYEIKIPLKTVERIDQYMLNDLNRYFTHQLNIIAKVEKRNYTAYVIKDTQAIVSKSIPTEKSIITTKNSYKYTNQVFNLLMAALHSNLGLNEKEKAILINESSFKNNDLVSFEIPKRKDDFETLRRNLKNVGLVLVEESRDIETLVIKNATN